MAEKIPKGRSDFDEIPTEAAVEDIRRLDESRVTSALAALVSEAETMRLKYMKKLQGRRFLTSTLGLIAAIAGSVAFGWYFFMQFDLEKALSYLLPALLLPFLLTLWSVRPAVAYSRDFKRIFMPRLAQALGGFQFFSHRGVSAKICAQTGVLPPHDRYSAEDCFSGIYKGVKVIFSEARLYNRKKQEPVFQGLFVLLQTPQEVFEGHTIITADRKMAENWELTRWKKLRPVTIAPPSNPAWDRFVIYSNKPDVAQMLAGDKLLKELSEACDAFACAATAVFFGGKYVFLMVPERKDMFEASDVYVPVTLKRYATDLKREIIRLLEIIDIFEIYRSGKA